jgi:arylsulfatase A-like enzyme
MILLDDLGFAQLGCYGSAVGTPHIDALAERGLRYNNFHVAAICSATRACLLTGRNHHAVGMGFFPDQPMVFPGYSGRIPKAAGTLPRLLRDQGYNTFAVGKWHLTPRFEWTASGPFDRWPLGMGFERYYGFLSGWTNQWSPDLACDNGLIDPPAAPDDGYHLTEDLATQAIRFVQDQQQATPDKPFFLYFAPGAMHDPHQVHEAWVEPYRGLFDEGWEALRDQTFLRQQELGVVPRGTTLPARPSWVAAWDELSADERRVVARQMEVYAGFLTHSDAQIGRLLDFLRRIEALEDTIVMVLSDNGASAEGGPHGFLDESATDVASMLSRIDDFGGHRAFNHYAWGWAWAGNTPFRLWKRYAWLGGVRVPLIVHWPAGISADCNGEVRSQFCHAIDLMPTTLAAAGVTAPESLDGVTQQPLDGASILPTLGDDGSPAPRSTQYFETLGSRAIYHDGWKATTDHVDSTRPAERALIPGSHDFDSDSWALFRVADDFAEAHDLAAEQPEQLRRMTEFWWHEAGRNQVLPLCEGILTEQRAAGFEPPPYPDRREYVYRPGGGPVITRSFLPGFRLIADVEVPEDGRASGVICAHHVFSFGATVPGGWACYVLDGRLVVAFDAAGLTARLALDGAGLTGRHEVEVVYVPGSDAEGRLSLSLDGREPATHRVPAGAGSAVLQYLEGKLMIGRDQGFPLSSDYEPPFAFSGLVHSVRYAVPPSAPGDLREDIGAVMRHD